MPSPYLIYLQITLPSADELQPSIQEEGLHTSHRSPATEGPGLDEMPEVGSCMMWIAKVFFFLLLFATGPLLRSFFLPFFLFPAFGLALQGPSPSIARPDGLELHRGLHKSMFRRALMAPMPVRKCSVLYEPGARRHALESEALGRCQGRVALQVHRRYCYRRTRSTHVHCKAVASGVRPC
jgi:hypothetical protein